MGRRASLAAPRRPAPARIEDPRAGLRTSPRGLSACLRLLSLGRRRHSSRYPGLPLVCATRAVHASLNASASSHVMQSAYCAETSTPRGARARRWFAWMGRAELGAALHSALCREAEAARRGAARAEWARLLLRSREQPLLAAPRAPPVPRAAPLPVPCVCVGRPAEGLSARHEAALAAACARLAAPGLAHSGAALLKYRTLGEARDPPAAHAPPPPHAPHAHAHLSPHAPPHVPPPIPRRPVRGADASGRSAGLAARPSCRWLVPAPALLPPLRPR